MARDTARSVQLKDDGNKQFGKGQYTAAEALYSKAIIADDSNPALYTNRAMARLKLELWDSAISDCQECLRLNPQSMKAYYILAQAQVGLRNHEEALADALKAHELCVALSDKSLANITALVLQIKKSRWDEMEKRRIREQSALEAEVISLMESECQQALRECSDPVESSSISEEWQEKIALVTQTFEKSRSADQKKRTVPDWAIDDISFQFMLDPVITKTGKSYERSAIMEHLRRHPTDPLTREPLLPSDLRPNLALKQACEEFLAENGWAADW